MTHGGVRQSHYGIKIGAVLSLLATTHGHYCLLAGISFGQSPFPFPLTPSLSPPSATSTLNFIPIHLHLRQNALLSTSFPYPLLSHFSSSSVPLSSLLSGVLRCSLIRASGIGCHYLSAVSGTLGTVQYCISIGK